VLEPSLLLVLVLVLVDNSAQVAEPRLLELPSFVGSAATSSK
jgi:hypothetical protein